MLNILLKILLNFMIFVIFSNWSFLDEFSFLENLSRYKKSSLFLFPFCTIIFSPNTDWNFLNLITFHNGLCGLWIVDAAFFVIKIVSCFYVLMYKLVRFYISADFEKILYQWSLEKLNIGPRMVLDYFLYIWTVYLTAPKMFLLSFVKIYKR